MEADFSGTDLERADFSGSDLRRAAFGGAKLREADLRSATGYAIDPRETDVTGASFSFPDAAGLLEVFGVVLDGGGPKAAKRRGR